MGRFRSGYNNYRGRRTVTDILKWIAIVLGVLVVVMLGVLFFAQEDLVFTDSGLKWPDPFAQTGGAQSTQESGEINVVIQPPAGSESSSQEETGAVPETGEEMSGLELPVSAVLDGTDQDQLTAAGANALILEMKDTEGKLGWSSQQPLAVQGGVNSTQSGVNEALQTWNQGDVYTIARVCCFRDNTMPYQHNNMALRANYGNWRDELGLRWLNPDSQEVWDYLSGLCGELAQLGFDEIVLECCAFPTQGNLEAIVHNGSYGTGEFQTAIESFLQQVQTAIEPYGTTLSIQASRNEVSGTVSGSGLTGAVLEQYADRIWMIQDHLEPQLASLLENAGVTQAETRLVEQEETDQGTYQVQGRLPQN